MVFYKASNLLRKATKTVVRPERTSLCGLTLITASALVVFASNTSLTDRSGWVSDFIKGFCFMLIPASIVGGIIIYSDWPNWHGETILAGILTAAILAAMITRTD
jgi:hypothetical protein